MKLLNPAGLWLLLGVPILIIIYLIRSQHEDRAVSSTFIWKLSSKFVKKRIPIQRIRRILLFLLQLLLIIGSAFIASKPTFIEGETYDYIVILDSSASMQQKDQDGNTRFDNAKDMIKNLSKEIKKGHTLTLIVASDSPSYSFRQTDSVNEVNLALNNLKCSYGSCNVEEAISLAQEMCDRTDSAKVFFYTDKEYEQSGNIGIINLSNNEWNVSLEGLTSSQKSDHTQFKGTITSYNMDATVTIGLKIDGKPVDVQVVDLEADVSAEVVFKTEEPVNFDTAEIYIETKDALVDDNSFALCKKNRKKYEVLIVSSSPLYIQRAIESLDNCKLSIFSSLDDVKLSGYDLYIFDSITPEIYPTDGAIIQFGTKTLPTGLNTGSQYNLINRLSKNNKIESEVFEGLEFSDTVVNGYYSFIGNTDWKMLLYCRTAAVCATMERENGTCVTVFSFDLHDSNLPLKSSFLVLMKNLVEYSIPTMISNTSIPFGQSINISVLYGTDNIYLKYPDETVRELLASEKNHVIYPEQLGIYTAVMQDGTEGDYADFYVHIPSGEMATGIGPAVNVVLNNSIKEASPAYSGIWYWVAFIMLLLILAEWGVYYYEQY